jgi:beta-xylosidase
MKNILILLMLQPLFLFAQSNSIRPGAILPDNNGVHVNAHGGGILFHEGKYYWYGEHKSENTSAAMVGVTCYSSDNLSDWKYEGVALSVSDNKNSPIVRGCIIERPKVIYNAATKKFVMYFHLELKGKGYEAANVGVAVADSPTGKFEFLKNSRVNAGIFPLNMTAEQQKSAVKTTDFEDWWTPQWHKAVDDGMFVRRDLKSGQMSRDMTLFVDDDGRAYHIYSSEENLTLQIAELTDDYLNYTGQYARIAPGGHNEAPAIFKKRRQIFYDNIRLHRLGPECRTTIYGRFAVWNVDTIP